MIGNFARKAASTVAFATLLVATGAAVVRSQTPLDIRQVEPEAATGWTAKPAAVAQRHMIVAANPLAVEAGLGILRAGGSAVDAAIATQLVLGLVEPQSSGIGGGGFLVTWDAKTKTVETIDGRETAPMAARPDRFLDATGRVRAFRDLVSSPLSVGVPGLVSALELAHRAHGRLAWARLFEPAIGLAERGFAVSPRLHALLAAQGLDYFNGEARALYFEDNGSPRPVGAWLKVPAYATTLRSVAEGGAKAFQGGAIANAIVRALQAAGLATKFASDMTVADLAGYVAKTREPVCAPYRAHRICSMGPPSSGGIAMGMVLGMVESMADHPANARVKGPVRGLKRAGDACAVLADNMYDIAVLAEAQKLAYADRDHFVADPDFVPQSANLLDPGYLAARARLIDPSAPMTAARPGSPPLKFSQNLGADATVEQQGTTHISIVDGWGNGIAMTTSVQTAFGSGIMVGGFLLNSQLTDFSFAPTDGNGTAIANRVEGGKRPRSSMAPTIVFDRAGDVFAVLGSPGGNRIILYNLKGIVCMIDWRCDTELAASLPNFGSRNGPIEVETGGVAQAELIPALQAIGAEVQPSEMTSGLAIIGRRDGIVEGAADPRREGVAQGD